MRQTPSGDRFVNYDVVVNVLEALLGTPGVPMPSLKIPSATVRSQTGFLPHIGHPLRASNRRV
jgi:hypothetical protein